MTAAQEVAAGTQTLDLVLETRPSCSPSQVKMFVSDELDNRKLTLDVYVLMGGQLLAPHTRPKWMSGSASVRAMASLGSPLGNGLLNWPTPFLLALRTPFSMSCREYSWPPIMYLVLLKNWNEISLYCWKKLKWKIIVLLKNWNRKIFCLVEKLKWKNYCIVEKLK